MKILQGVGNTEVEKHKQLFLSVWNGISEWYIIEKPVSSTQKRPYSANCWGVGDRINIPFHISQNNYIKNDRRPC
jgi:hypothetical protein